MNKKKLMSLLTKNEGIKLDYKLRLDIFSDTGKKEIAKDICAIANTGSGRGYIIVGIQDKTKKIIGLKKEDVFREEQIQQIVTSRCEPPIPIEVEFLNIDNKKVGIITIYDGGQKPYQIRENGAFYIRRGSTTDIMRKQEIINLLEQNLNLTIETCPLIRSNISMLNMDLVNTYFKNKGITLTDENKEFLLITAGIAYQEKQGDKLKCTYGGLLIFSDINYLCIPNNMIKIIDKTHGKFGTVHVIQGNLLSMIDKSYKILKDIMSVEFPIASITEAINNAVLYREYYDLNRIIEVTINKSSIVISSPGELIDENTKGQRTHYNKRNIWIYEKLTTLDQEKRFINNGQGFMRIREAIKNNGSVKFVNSRIEHSFKVIIIYKK